MDGAALKNIWQISRNIGNDAGGPAWSTAGPAGIQFMMIPI